MGNVSESTRLGPLVRILSSRLNLDILLILSLGDSYPREISSMLGKDETDVSRRLKKMEEVGLVKGYWRRLAGRNVRTYRLAVSSITLSFGSGTVEIELSGGAKESLSLTPPLEVTKYPEPVGREEELRELSDESSDLVHIWGPPGVGKTHLVSYHVLNNYERVPIAWIRGSRRETEKSMMWRIASALALYGRTEALESLAGGDTESLLSLASSSGLVVVVDDYQDLSEETKEVVLKVAEGLEGGRTYIVSRPYERKMMAWGSRSKALELGPLELEPFERILTEATKRRLRTKEVEEAWRILRGIPGLVGLVARLIDKYDLIEAARRAWNSYYEGLVHTSGLGAGRAVVEVLSTVSGRVRIRHVCRAAGLSFAECRAVVEDLKVKGVVEEELGELRLRGLYRGSKDLGDLTEAAERLARSLSGSGIDSEKVWSLEVSANYCLHRIAGPMARDRLVKSSTYVLCCPARYAEAMKALYRCPMAGVAKAYYRAEEAIAEVNIGVIDTREGARVLEDILEKFLLDPAARARIYAILTTYHALEGDLSSARSSFRMAVELLSRISRRERAYVESSIYSSGTLLYYELGMIDEAKRAAEREAEINARLGDTMNYYTSIIHVAELERLSGRFAEALRKVEEIERDLKGTLGYSVIKVMLLIVKTYSLASLGRYGEVLALLSNIPPSPHRYASELYTVRASANYLTGRRREALEDANRALDLGACKASKEACLLSSIVKALSKGEEPPVPREVPKALRPIIKALLG